MRALKVAVLLVLVLAAMRATIWILQWMLSRLARIPGRVAVFFWTPLKRQGGAEPGRGR
jgi:hypothetical protein